MKTVITHNQPHLDDICAMWIMARYLPGWEAATFEYIPANTTPSTVQDTKDRIHVGTGRGRFDEHKGDHDDCATTLVAKYVYETAEIPDAERKALDKMTAWVFTEDTGKLQGEPRREFSVPAALQLAFFSEGRDSERVRAIGFSILDAIMVGLRNQVIIEEDWKDRIEFDSKYGRAIGIRTDGQELPGYAYGKGFDLVVLVGKDTPYATIRATAGSATDLTEVRERIAAAEDVPWFFHHSKKMLICGGQKTDGKCRTTLSLEQLIGMTK
jgi:hypothetical protein